VIHVALVTAVHVHVLVVETLTSPVPSLGPTKSDVRDSEYVHAGGGGGVGGGGVGGGGGGGGTPEACLTTIR
jgi:hypothetical protein